MVQRATSLNLHHWTSASQPIIFHSLSIPGLKKTKTKKTLKAAYLFATLVCYGFFSFSSALFTRYVDLLYISVDVATTKK